MKRAASIILIVSIFITAVSCGGGRSQSGGKDRPKPVGGCAIDTVPLGLRAGSGCGGKATPDRISILSVERAPDGTYEEAAGVLFSVLDSLGIDVCNDPVLAIVREGPCWPRFRVDLRLEKGSSKQFDRIRTVLEDSAICGIIPHGERLEGYGTFFIQAASGSSDRWTLWYAR